MLTTCTLMNTSTCLQSYLLNYVLLLFNFGALSLVTLGKKKACVEIKVIRTKKSKLHQFMSITTFLSPKSGLEDDKEHSFLVDTLLEVDHLNLFIIMVYGQNLIHVHQGKRGIKFPPSNKWEGWRSSPTRSFWDTEYFTQYTHGNTITNAIVRHCSTINCLWLNEI